MNSLSIGFWRSGSRAPENRHLRAAVACSFVLHAMLMPFTGGAEHSNGAGPLLSSAARSAPAFLMASLAENRRASVSAPAGRGEADRFESAPQIQESPASVVTSRPQEARKETPADRQVAAKSSGSLESPAPGETVSPAALPAAATGRTSSDEESARLARHASYALASLLDVPPMPLSDIQPDYPESAGNQQGTVVLRLFISASGEVDELFVVRALPSGFFEEAALTAFAPARFSPGMHHGRAVKSQMVVEVQFVPFNRGAGVSGRGY